MANMTYAFDTVLDRAIEAEKKVATLEERNRFGNHQTELLKRDLNNARSDLTTAKVKLEKFEKGEDSFTALYDAAENAAKKLDIEGLIEAAVPLRAAVTAARKFIDPIPF